MLTLILWSLLVPLGLFCLYTAFLDFNRDVPHEYLEQQTLLEQTRQPNELAIHKSPKLDYSTGLRIGLGIRYDSYKLRNGNLNDIWEILVAHHGSSKEDTIVVNGDSIRISQLNYVVCKISECLKSLTDVLEVAIPVSLFMVNKFAFAVAIAAFLAQVPVHVYESDAKQHLDNSAIAFSQEGSAALLKRLSDDSLVLDLQEFDFLTDKPDFENNYSVEKDRGIALKLSTRLNHKVIALTSFTQLNLISAVASCIKHLPPSKQIGPHDRIVISQDHSTPESILNEVVKVLVLFVSGASLVLTQEDNFMVHKPTILVASSPEIQKLGSAQITGLLYYHRLYSLSRLRFSPLASSSGLRLIYVHRDCSTGKYTNWNHLRAALGVNIVEEVGHFNVAGPFLVTDYYDYRTFLEKLASQVAASGGICQANEIKLLEFDATQSGALALRGYNIGKAVTIMEGVGQTRVTPDASGFFRLPFNCRWGLDGCLYVLKRTV